ncbi:MAG: hypothetical protein ACREDR_11450, partial [Blastocatellia bacterium]
SYLPATSRNAEISPPSTEDIGFEYFLLNSERAVLLIPTGISLIYPKCCYLNGSAVGLEDWAQAPAGGIGSLLLALITCAKNAFDGPEFEHSLRIDALPRAIVAARSFRLDDLGRKPSTVQAAAFHLVFSVDAAKGPGGLHRWRNVRDLANQLKLRTAPLETLDARLVAFSENEFRLRIAINDDLWPQAFMLFACESETLVIPAEMKVSERDNDGVRLCEVRLSGVRSNGSLPARPDGVVMMSRASITRLRFN